MNPNEYVVTRIKQVRDSLGLSQNQMAADIGLSQSTLWAIEKGQRALHSRHLKLISAKYNVSEDWLKSGNGNMFLTKYDSVPTSAQFSPQKQALLNAVAAMPDREIDVLTAAIIAAADQIKKASPEGET